MFIGHIAQLCEKRWTMGVMKIRISGKIQGIPELSRHTISLPHVENIMQCK